MTEASSRVLVTVRVSLEVGVILSSVVVREFEDTFPVESVLCLFIGRQVFIALLRECQEVEGLEEDVKSMDVSL